MASMIGLLNYAACIQIPIALQFTQTATAHPAVYSIESCSTPALRLGLGRRSQWLRAGILQT